MSQVTAKKNDINMLLSILNDHEKAIQCKQHKLFFIYIKYTIGYTDSVKPNNGIFRPNISPKIFGLKFVIFTYIHKKTKACIYLPYDIPSYFSAIMDQKLYQQIT